MLNLLTIGTIFFLISASSTGVVPIGKDTYMVSIQAAIGFSGSGKLKSKAIKEATEYCTNLNKSLQIVSTWEASPPYILANFPKAEITFMCLNQNDPEYARPKLKPEADTNVDVTVNDNTESNIKNIQPDIYSELIKLDDLRKKGIINEPEFELLKKKLLSGEK